MTGAYYNEFDPNAAAWLRELIKRGLIADGEVDTRSIVDVRADDLRGFTQCHWFAGIGGWSYALRLAGWPDDRPVWTGSCPCPPFSAAGKGSKCPSCGGKSCLSHPLVTAGWVCLDCGEEWRGDDRHLLPEFLRLIGECRPATVFGEQVASRDGRLWLYALRSTVERVGYALGAADLCAAGIGSPHIRQRLYFVGKRLADADHARSQGRREPRVECVTERPPGPGGMAGRLANTMPAGWPEGRAITGDGQASGGSGDSRLADADGGDAGTEGIQRGGEHGQQPQDDGIGGMADAGNAQWRAVGEYRENGCDGSINGREEAHSLAGTRSEVRRPGQADSFWRDADWLFCRDGKWRPVKPAVLGVADGLPGVVVPCGPVLPASFPLGKKQERRVMRLRGYGNAIVPQVAAAFIEAAS